MYTDSIVLTQYAQFPMQWNSSTGTGRSSHTNPTVYPQTCAILYICLPLKYDRGFSRQMVPDPYTDGNVRLSAFQRRIVRQQQRSSRPHFATSHSSTDQSSAHQAVVMNACMTAVTGLTNHSEWLKIGGFLQTPRAPGQLSTCRKFQSQERITVLGLKYTGA